MTILPVCAARPALRLDLDQGRAAALASIWGMLLLLHRIDRCCAQLNAGLTAVALALSLLLLVAATIEAGNYAISQGLGSAADSFMPPF